MTAQELVQDVVDVELALRAAVHDPLNGQAAVHEPQDIALVVGGVIPDEDVPALRESGVADVVLQDTPPDEVVSRVRAAVEARRAR